MFDQYPIRVPHLYKSWIWRKKGYPTKTKKDAFMDRKGKSETYSIQDKDIKCSKCLGMSILFFSVQTKSYIYKRQ